MRDTTSEIRVCFGKAVRYNRLSDLYAAIHATNTLAGTVAPAPVSWT